MTRLEVPWLSHPPLQKLFTLFQEQGADLRLVGGAVRDGLLGLPVQDIDLAVNRDPQWVLNLLALYGVQAIPTGLAHGTVTAILDHESYQITTLRVDVKTFGRRAEVTFTEDWVQDAQRRDFTINAIYANQEGILFDPVGGIEDLAQQRVRFIGNAETRIQEDFLRILRFFRFSARFGKEPYEETGLAACSHLAPHLPTLARERITEEFLKILQVPFPLSIMRQMETTGILDLMIPNPSWQILPNLLKLERQIDPLIRIAALDPDLRALKTRLRFSKKQERTLDYLAASHPLLTLSSLKKYAYLFGKQPTLDLALLQTARQMATTDLSEEQGRAFLKGAHAPWTVPVFPLRGADILHQGIKEGHQVGAALKQVEAWWLEQDLIPDHSACMAYLETLL